MYSLSLRMPVLAVVLAVIGLRVGPVLAQTPAPIPDGLQTVEFYSPAVDRTMKFDIVLPSGYDASEQRYPVLYLLHGYMQNYTVWGRNLAAGWYARNLDELIVVLPDAGNSWYINYAVSDDGQRNHWEDHIIEDVIGYVDSHFRTEARREGRALAGLSMGGFGALALGFRHPELFVSLGSTSGALGHARDAATAIRAGIQRTPTQTPGVQDPRFAQADEFIAGIVDIPGFSTQAERTPAGVDFATAEQAEAYDPFTIIYEVPRSEIPHIYLDAGTGDQYITEAREMLQLLLINNVAVDYMQDKGAHNSEYWRRSIGHMMTIQNEVMQRALGERP